MRLTVPIKNTSFGGDLSLKQRQIITIQRCFVRFLVPSRYPGTGMSVVFDLGASRKASNPGPFTLVASGSLRAGLSG